MPGLLPSANRSRSPKPKPLLRGAGRRKLSGVPLLRSRQLEEDQARHPQLRGNDVWFGFPDQVQGDGDDAQVPARAWDMSAWGIFTAKSGLW